MLVDRNCTQDPNPALVNLKGGDVFYLVGGCTPLMKMDTLGSFNAIRLCDGKTFYYANHTEVIPCPRAIVFVYGKKEA